MIDVNKDPLATGQSVLCPECGAELSGGGQKIPISAMAVCTGCTKILVCVGGPWAEIVESIRVPPARYAEFANLEKAARALRRMRNGGRVELVS